MLQSIQFEQKTTLHVSYWFVTLDQATLIEVVEKLLLYQPPPQRNFLRLIEEYIISLDPSGDRSIGDLCSIG